jgi:hypothetical protein
MMKKTLAVLLVAVIATSTIDLPSSPAFADDYYSYGNDGWSSERNWRDGYHRDRNDDYFRERERNDYQDQEYRRDHSESRHKKRDTAIIAGIAGLALGAVIVGTLASQTQDTPVYSRSAHRDRLVYDPNY